MEAKGNSVSMRIDQPDLAAKLRELGPRHGFGPCVAMTITGSDGRPVILLTLLDDAGGASTGAIEERLRNLFLDVRGSDPGAPVAAPSKFTPAEHAVLKWLRLGRTNRDIARILHKSEFTVKTHVQHMLAKTGLDNRLQLASVADC